MKLKNKFKKRNSDPDLDWLHEDGPPDALGVSYRSHTQAKKPLWESISYRLRCGLAIVICLFIPVLWYVNQQLSALADSSSKPGSELFKDSTPSRLTPFADTGNMELTDYMSAFSELPYADKFSMTEISAFYHTGLTIDYLDKLNKGGYLDELSFPAVIVYFETGVPLDYLNQMKESGYLSLFSYPAVAAFYESGLPIDFLHELKEKNLLEDLSFVDILVMFDNQ